MFLCFGGKVNFWTMKLLAVKFSHFDTDEYMISWMDPTTKSVKIGNRRIDYFLKKCDIKLQWN